MVVHRRALKLNWNLASVLLMSSGGTPSACPTAANGAVFTSLVQRPNSR